MKDGTFPGLMIVLMAAALILGGLLGALLFPVEIVPDCPKCAVCAEPEPCVPETITETVTEYVPLSLAETYLNPAIQDFEKELFEQDLMCDGYEYEADEVSVKKVYDDWNLTLDGDDYTVDFRIRYRYDSEEERCYAAYNVTIFYEEGEDPVVNY